MDQIDPKKARKTTGFVLILLIAALVGSVALVSRQPADGTIEIARIEPERDTPAPENTIDMDGFTGLRAAIEAEIEASGSQTAAESDAAASDGLGTGDPSPLVAQSDPEAASPDDATQAFDDQLAIASADTEDTADTAPERAEPSGDSVVAGDAPTALSSEIGLDLVRVDPEGAALVAGFAPAGNEVVLMVEDEELTRSVADKTGRFVSLFDLPISEAPRSLTLGVVDANGEVEFSPTHVLIAPVRVASDAPVISDADTVNVKADPLVVTATGDEVAVVQPPAQPAVPGVGDARNIVIDTIAYDLDGEVNLTGRGTSDAKVRVYIDDLAVEATEVQPDGSWSVPLANIDAGVYRLRVDEVDRDGNVVSRIETPFQRERVELAADASGSVTVQPGFTLWAIAQQNLGSGTRFVQVYEANRDLIRDPDLIYPGQVFALPEGG